MANSGVYEKNSAVPTEKYVSCIKIHGYRILPPILNEEKRKQMQYYKDLAVKTEQKRKWKKITLNSVESTDDGYFPTYIDTEDTSSTSDSPPYSSDKSSGDYTFASQIFNDTYRSDILDMLKDKSGICLPSTENTAIKNVPLDNESDNDKPLAKNSSNLPLDATTGEADNKSSFCKTNHPTLRQQSYTINEDNVFTEDILRELTGTENCDNSPTNLNDDVVSNSTGDNEKSSEKFVENANRSPPPLIRSNSYILESPSPLLLAQMRRNSEKEVDPPQKSEKIGRKRRSWDLANAREKWSSIEHDLNFAANSSKKRENIPSSEISDDRSRDNKPIFNSLPPSTSGSPNVKMFNTSCENLTRSSPNKYSFKLCRGHLPEKKPDTPISQRGRTFKRTHKTPEVQKRFIKSFVTPRRNTQQGKPAEKELSPKKVGAETPKKIESAFKRINAQVKLNKPTKESNASSSSSLSKPSKCPAAKSQNSSAPKNASEEKNTTQKPAQIVLPKKPEFFPSEESEEHIRRIIERIQSEQSKQMAELIARQNKEQENLMKIFAEQQTLLLTNLRDTYRKLNSVETNPESKCNVTSAVINPDVLVLDLDASKEANALHETNTLKDSQCLNPEPLQDATLLKNSSPVHPADFNSEVLKNLEALKHFDAVKNPESIKNSGVFRYLEATQYSDLLKKPEVLKNLESLNQVVRSPESLKNMQGSKDLNPLRNLEDLKCSDIGNNPEVLQNTGKQLEYSDVVNNPEALKNLEGLKQVDILKNGEALKNLESSKKREALQYLDSLKNSEAHRNCLDDLKNSESVKNFESLTIYSELLKDPGALKHLESLKNVEALQYSDVQNIADAMKKLEALKYLDILEKPNALSHLEFPQNSQAVKNSQILKSSEALKNSHTLKNAEALKNFQVLKSPEVSKNSHTLKISEALKNSQILKSSDASKNSHSLKASEVLKNSPTLKTQNGFKNSPASKEVKVWSGLEAVKDTSRAPKNSEMWKNSEAIKNLEALKSFKILKNTETFSSAVKDAESLKDSQILKNSESLVEECRKLLQNQHVDSAAVNLACSSSQTLYQTPENSSEDTLADLTIQSASSDDEDVIFYSTDTCSPSGHLSPGSTNQPDKCPKFNNSYSEDLQISKDQTNRSSNFEGLFSEDSLERDTGGVSARMSVPKRNISPQKGRQKSVQCSRQLFPSNKQIWAATKICAAARGYLVRRLMKTERVQNLIQTIRDTLICAMELHRETAENIQPADVELHRRLIQQVTAACYTFHDTFFSFSKDDQMSIIAQDRERQKEKMLRPVSARNNSSLSSTTQKVLERKMRRKSAESAPTSRSSSSRSYYSASEYRTRTKSLGLTDSVQSSKKTSPQSDVMRRSVSYGANKKPWR